MRILVREKQFSALNTVRAFFYQQVSTRIVFLIFLFLHISLPGLRGFDNAIRIGQTCNFHAIFFNESRLSWCPVALSLTMLRIPVVFEKCVYMREKEHFEV